MSLFSTAKKLLLAAKLDKNQSVTIIYDDQERNIGLAFKSAAQELKDQNKLKEYFTFNLNDIGERPIPKIPVFVFNAVKKSQLVLTIIAKKTIKNGEYETVRKPLLEESLKRGKRIGCLYDVPPEVFSEIFAYDPKKIKEFNKKLFETLQGNHTIKITTPAGTNLTVELSEKYTLVNQDADLSTVSPQHSLLAGEVYGYPSNVNGILVVDGVMGGNFAGFSLKDPLIVYIEEGKIKKFESKNKELEAKFGRYLKRYKNFNRVGEIGFGTNLMLDRFYNVIGIDEKYPGNHIAFGNPYPKRTNARWKCQAHIDCVLKECTTEIDGIKVIEKGKYCTEQLFNQRR